MNKNEIDDIRWSGIGSISPVDEQLAEECLDVLNYINGRKSDVVNWEERAEMDNATRRNSTFNSELLLDNQAQQDNSEISKAEKFSGNEKENELMSSFADTMSALEVSDE